MKKAGVAILGLGVVGGGTYKILTDNREYFKKTQNVDVTVESVLEKNVDRALSLGIERDAQRQKAGCKFPLLRRGELLYASHPQHAQTACKIKH